MNKADMRERMAYFCVSNMENCDDCKRCPVDYEDDKKVAMLVALYNEESEDE